jgi:nucleoside-diphosphate-sugar epimerase
MARKIFFAGATGAIGKRLVPLLRDAGFEVTGATRSAGKADALRAAGATPVVVDVYDAAALTRAVVAARPEIVIHQLTDLPPGLDPNRMAASTPLNARIRTEGTRNLVTAAREAGARRLIAHSIAWAYAPGPEPHGEDDPLDLKAEGARAISVGGVAALERLTLGSPPIEGVVLRYGQFYGPGTGIEQRTGASLVHIDAAASATLLAIDRARPGVYNIAEDSKSVTTAKARREIGWDPAFRLPSR